MVSITKTSPAGMAGLFATHCDCPAGTKQSILNALGDEVTAGMGIFVLGVDRGNLDHGHDQQHRQKRERLLQSEAHLRLPSRVGWTAVYTVSVDFDGCRSNTPPT
jgi:hypothetical protein